MKVRDTNSYFNIYFTGFNYLKKKYRNQFKIFTVIEFNYDNKSSKFIPIWCNVFNNLNNVI